jgi:hypothetical protein
MVSHSLKRVGRTQALGALTENADSKSHSDYELHTSCKNKKATLTDSLNRPFAIPQLTIP